MKPASPPARRGLPGAGDPSQRFVTDHFAHAGAETGIDRALRLDTMVMLVDDPVKRVDNMTMAWGWRAESVPRPRAGRAGGHLPAGAESRTRRQGCAERGCATGIPSEVIDRPKGYFPVPALTHLQGPYLDMVRDALYAPAAKERGLFDTKRWTRCWPTPTAG